MPTPEQQRQHHSNSGASHFINEVCHLFNSPFRAETRERALCGELWDAKRANAVAAL